MDEIADDGREEEPDQAGERDRASRVGRRMLELRDEVRRLPVEDDRDAESILGYDEHGLPT